VEAQRFLLLAADTDGAALRGELQRYVLRSKVTLREDAWRLRAGIGATPFDPAALAWDAGRWILPEAGPALAPAGADPGLQRRWEDLDLARGIPHLPARLADRYTPQMLGLARLQAFSLSKGCYPGQEIVARTHYLGQLKREWTLLRAGRALQDGEAVLQGGREVGEILQRAPGQPQHGAAVLPRDGGADFTLTDGSVLQVNAPAQE
jgi:tRNA-modifying protein YgfZ